jgi:hypothetical protein
MTGQINELSSRDYSEDLLMSSKRTSGVFKDQPEPLTISRKVSTNIKGALDNLALTAGVTISDASSGSHLPGIGADAFSKNLALPLSAGKMQNITNQNEVLPQSKAAKAFNAASTSEKITNQNEITLQSKAEKASETVTNPSSEANQNIGHVHPPPPPPGVPLPPPLPMKKAAAASSNFIVSSKNLKTFNWTKVIATQNSVWNQIANNDLSQAMSQVFEDMDQLFVAKQNFVTVNSEVAKPDTTILSAKRAQNIGIFIVTRYYVDSY